MGTFFLFKAIVRPVKRNSGQINWFCPQSKSLNPEALPFNPEAPSFNPDGMN
jgi:hypothetical protein